MLHLIQSASPRGFVGPPAQEACAMAKPATGEMVVLDFDHKFGGERLPLDGTIR